MKIHNRSNSNESDFAKFSFNFQVKLKQNSMIY